MLNDAHRQLVKLTGSILVLIILTKQPVVTVMKGSSLSLDSHSLCTNQSSPMAANTVSCL